MYVLWRTRRESAGLLGMEREEKGKLVEGGGEGVKGPTSTGRKGGAYCR